MMCGLPRWAVMLQMVYRWFAEVTIRGSANTITSRGVRVYQDTNSAASSIQGLNSSFKPIVNFASSVYRATLKANATPATLPVFSSVDVKIGSNDVLLFLRDLTFPNTRIIHISGCRTDWTTPRCNLIAGETCTPADGVILVAKGYE